MIMRHLEWPSEQNKMYGVFTIVFGSLAITNLIEMLVYAGGMCVCACAVWEFILSNK